MVRNYKKKRDLTVNEDDVKRAMEHVLNKTMKLREAAGIFGITKSTLGYRIKLYQNNQRSKSDDYSSKYSVSQVFTTSEEDMLEKYILKSSKMNYGLTYQQTRLLAYQYAKALKKCPEIWETHQMAGIEWLKGYMRRHRSLSLRKPENTSLSRATSFNRHNVTEFQDNYQRALQKAMFSPDRIFNIDETNIMTVVQAPNVIAAREQKQVGQSVSAERGQLITMCGIVNAAGNSIPPVFIYPRARFQESMLTGGPNGCIGFANSPTSGWMTGILFLKVLEHLQKHTRCSINDKILLLVDNHESHCTIDCINFCRDNGIVLLTFPPHCTHRLQPLDVSVMGPFKQKLAVSQNDWLLNHPGKTITIHDLAGIVTPAYNASFTPNNITSGFKKPGIFPFSRNAFTDDDFECAEITNRPLLQDSISEVADTAALTSSDINESAFVIEQPLNASSIPAEMQQSASEAGIQTEEAPDLSNNDNEESLAVVTFPDIISPEMVRPYPKAAPRKEGSRGRKKGKSRILTETPEKAEIEAAYLERQKRLEKSELRKSKVFQRKPKPKRTKTLKPNSSSDDTEEEAQYSVHSDTDVDFTDEDDNARQNIEDNSRNTAEVNVQDINPGDFCLIQCSSKNNNISLAFVSKVEEKFENTLTVNFLKKKSGFNKFFYPDKEDKWPISILDVLAKLPSPTDAGSTSRTAAMMTFRFDFSAFKLG